MSCAQRLIPTFNSIAQIDSREYGELDPSETIRLFRVFILEAVHVVTALVPETAVTFDIQEVK